MRPFGWADPYALSILRHGDNQQCAVWEPATATAMGRAISVFEGVVEGQALEMQNSKGAAPRPIAAA